MELKWVVLGIVFIAIMMLCSFKFKTNENGDIKGNTCGIVSCILGILAFFTGVVGIIFAIIGLFCGLKNSKNAFGLVGLIVSSIYLIVFLLGALGLVSILAMS
ncbi:hypothetical protein CRU92_01540 [Arcobacter sp. FW59]|nr:hypothetical protein CRU92_01540 [Arcobacter sp. FW59]